MAVQIAKAYLDFINCTKKYQCIIGGRNSGKTKHMAIRLCMTLRDSKTCLILCLRKHKVELHDSIYKEMETVLIDMGIDDQFDFYNSPLKIRNKLNGNTVIFGGLDNPSSNYKSIHGLTHVFCDEADSLTYEDFKTINFSIRGGEANDRRFFLAMNPISATHWIKARFYDTIDENSYAIKTTYRDILKWVSQDQIDEFDRMKIEDPRLYKVLADGEWGTEQTGMEIYTNFNYGKHVDVCEYKPNEVLYLSFDENTTPYITLLLAHIDDNKVNIIDEICLFRKNLHDTLDYFIQKYRNHFGGMVITGDATSKKLNVYDASFYTIISNTLSQFKPQLRVNNINHSIFNRTNWLNQCLINESIKLRINPSCKNLISDIEGVKRGSDSKKDKKTITRNGHTYQEFGHCTDALEYLLTTFFIEQFNTYQFGGNDFRVITGVRKGVGFRY